MNSKLTKTKSLQRKRLKISLSSLFSGFKNQPGKMVESLKPPGYEDQGYRDEN